MKILRNLILLDFSILFNNPAFYLWGLGAIVCIGLFSHTIVMPLTLLLWYFLALPFAMADIAQLEMLFVVLGARRRDIVRMYYLVLLITFILSALLLALASNFEQALKGELITSDILCMNIAKIVLPGLAIYSITYPLWFRFGAYNGRLVRTLIYTISLSMPISAMILFDKTGEISQWLSQSPSTLLIACACCGLLLLFISSIISTHLYKGRDFLT